jgi:uncharacterized protein YjbI with pentapeptide repeats
MADSTERADEIGAASDDGTLASAAAAPSPPGSATFAAKAKDLQALRDAVVDAASVGAGLWVSYLFVFFYLAIAAGGVTHRDMFFENPVKLPFLNVDLPLIGFFVLGPLLFLIVHAYTLLHFVLLAGKVGAFHTELQEQILDEDARARLRRQLPSNIFVQFLAGPREVRTGAMGFMLRLIAQITLVAGPIALLVFFQLQFLPYHDAAISWWQRLAVVADLALLWVLWPSVARGTAASLGRRDLRSGKVFACLLASLLPVLLVFTVATFPGERLDENLPTMPFVAAEWTPRKLLVAGEVDLVARRPRSLWSNRLVLPGIDVHDLVKFDSEAKIAALPTTVSLRGRHLEGAVLLGANLRRADFTGVQLTDAKLKGADLREAKFECADTLSQCADLRGASLDKAQLQGASLGGAKLQGASLDETKLQGAWLHYAQLQGASFNWAELQGASLDVAKLQGASLQNARLQGASLEEAELQGASLGGAQLQGAVLDRAEIQGASLDQVFVWRAVAPNADGARTIEPETAPKYEEVNCSTVMAPPTLLGPPPEVCDWSVDAFAALKRLIEAQVPPGDRRELALRRIGRLDPDDTKVEWESDTWHALKRASPPPKDYEKILAGILRDAGCAAEGAPYVIRRLLRSHQELTRALAPTFLDEANCPGAHGLSEEDKSALRKIRGPAAPPSVVTPVPPKP